MSPMNTAAPRAMRVGVLRGALALLTVVGFGATASLAAFTDRGEQMTTLAAGSIDLKFDGTTDDQPSGLASLSMSAARPGDRTIREVAVRNVGTLPLAYDLVVTSTTDGARDLATALRLSVIADATTCTIDAVAAGTAGGTTLVADAPLTPSPAFTAPQSLAPGGTAQRLCVSVVLPADAPAWTMGASSRVSLRFDASQGGGGASSGSATPTSAPAAVDPESITCSAVSGAGYDDLTVHWGAVSGSPASYAVHIAPREGQPQTFDGTSSTNSVTIRLPRAAADQWGNQTDQNFRGYGKYLMTVTATNAAGTSSPAYRTLDHSHWSPANCYWASPTGS